MPVTVGGPPAHVLQAWVPPGTPLTWIIAGGLVLAVVVGTMFRVAPADERIAVFRLGRLVGIKGPGVVVVLPGVDRSMRVPLRAMRVDLLWVKATTRDDVTVTVNGTALAFVYEPFSYALALESPSSATTAAAETEIRRYVAEHDLVELSDLRDSEQRGLSSRISDKTIEWGVEVTLVEFNRIEIQLKADLLRWAERFADQRRAAARRATRVLRSRRASRSTAQSRTEAPDVDITHTTVPGTGILHHCTTRSGQRFGVMVDNTNHRSLLIYSPTDPDVPEQTIVMDQDEADQVAEILHSRSILDRLNVLERRFAAIMDKSQ